MSLQILPYRPAGTVYGTLINCPQVEIGATVAMVSGPVMR